MIEETIGVGGMGAVYRAVDQKFGSVVAIKETFYGDAQLTEAFEREARLLNVLHHPILPHVSDHFTENNGHFLVMEYIEGDDVSDLLKQGKIFPVESVIGWGLDLLDGLDYLHSQDPPIIHRDIKPNNLKLTSRGRIVLLDFGMAKETSANTFGTKSVFGYSRRYSPLEQIDGSGTDARSDIFSLGATLYHLLTGSPPVDALARASAIVAGRGDPLLPANVVNPRVPEMISAALGAALSINAENRFESARAMSTALESTMDSIVPDQVALSVPHTTPEIAESRASEPVTDVPVTVIDAVPLGAEIDLPKHDVAHEPAVLREEDVASLPAALTADAARNAVAFNARREFGRRMRRALPVTIPSVQIRRPGRMSPALWLPILLLCLGLVLFGTYRGLFRSNQEEAAAPQTTTASESPVIQEQEIVAPEVAQSAPESEPEPVSDESAQLPTFSPEERSPLESRKGPIATRPERAASVRPERETKTPRSAQRQVENRKPSGERPRRVTRPAFEQPSVSSIEAIMTGIPYERRRRWEEDVLIEEDLRRRRLRRIRRDNRRTQQPF